MHVLLLLSGVFCVCLLGPFGPKYCSNPVFLLMFCLLLSVIENGILKSAIVVLLFISPFNSVSVCFSFGCFDCTLALLLLQVARELITFADWSYFQLMTI